MALFTISAAGAGVTSGSAAGAATGVALAMPAAAKRRGTMDECMTGKNSCLISVVTANPTPRMRAPTQHI